MGLLKIAGGTGADGHVTIDTPNANKMTMFERRLVIKPGRVIVEQREIRENHEGGVCRRARLTSEVELEELLREQV
jgi:hypothetical protein